VKASRCTPVKCWTEERGLLIAYHKARLVKKFVEENARRIELVFLPPYSPELNPDELAWAHVKARVAKATTVSRDEMKANVVGTLRRLQKLPHIVASFFRTPSCRYAVGL
jgi:transposase